MAKRKAKQARQASAPAATGWRSILKVHPAAEMFPRVSAEELATLTADILKNGMINPVAVTPDHELLDGICRLDALEATGYRVDRLSDGFLWVSWGDDDSDVDDLSGLLYQVVQTDPYDYVIAANAHRRHLTQAQKRELIAVLLKAKPNQSDNAIAKAAKTDPKTVAKKRANMEGRSEIPNVETRTDTKGRSQPARKARKAAARPRSPEETDLDDLMAKARETLGTGEGEEPDARARASVKANGAGNVQPIPTATRGAAQPIIKELTKNKVAAEERARAAEAQVADMQVKFFQANAEATALKARLVTQPVEPPKQTDVPTALDALIAAVNSDPTYADDIEKRKDLIETLADAIKVRFPHDFFLASIELGSSTPTKGKKNSRKKPAPAEPEEQADKEPV